MTAETVLGNLELRVADETEVPAEVSRCPGLAELWRAAREQRERQRRQGLGREDPSRRYLKD